MSPIANMCGTKNSEIEPADNGNGNVKGIYYFILADVFLIIKSVFSCLYKVITINELSNYCKSIKLFFLC